MAGGFGILLLFILIFRHIGACVKEGVEDSQGRARAEGNGRITYFGSRHEKFKHNNHDCHWALDHVRGHKWTDLITREVIWGAKVYGVAEMRQAKAAGKTKGTTYIYKDPQGKRFYIDLNTEEVYRVAKASLLKGVYKYETFFYTDFETMTKVIRKTDVQLAYEKACADKGIKRNFYDLDDIRLERADGFCVTKHSDEHYRDYKGWRVYQHGEENWAEQHFSINSISYEWDKEIGVV